MRVQWTTDALDDLAEIAEYIAQDSEGAAHRMYAKIHAEVESLYGMSARGHRGREPGTLDWPIQGTKYVAAYDIIDGNVVVLRIYHGSRDNWR